MPQRQKLQISKSDYYKVKTANMLCIFSLAVASFNFIFQLCNQLFYIKYDTALDTAYQLTYLILNNSVVFLLLPFVFAKKDRIGSIFLMLILCVFLEFFNIISISSKYYEVLIGNTLLTLIVVIIAISMICIIRYLAIKKEYSGLKYKLIIKIITAIYLLLFGIKIYVSVSLLYIDSILWFILWLISVLPLLFVMLSASFYTGFYEWFIIKHPIELFNQHNKM